MEGGMPNPIRRRRSIESDALAGIDLGLLVERQIIGIFGHQNLGDRCLRRQSALDQPGRSLGLQVALVFTDLVQALAAGAGLGVEVDYDLDPRQMRR